MGPAAWPGADPVIQGDWLEPGTHLANVTAYELGPDVFNRIHVVGLLVRRTPMSLAGYIDDDFAVRVDAMTYAAGISNLDFFAVARNAGSFIVA